MAWLIAIPGIDYQETKGKYRKTVPQKESQAVSLDQLNGSQGTVRSFPRAAPSSLKKTYDCPLGALRLTVGTV